MEVIKSPNESLHEATTNWFEKTISELAADHLTYETKTIDPHTKELYEKMATGKKDELMLHFTENLKQYYFREILNKFFTELFIVRKSQKPNKMAFDYKGKQIMIWVEIPDDNEKMENDIFMAEATSNYNFSNTGFNLSATIVEDSDHLDTPPHYVNFEFQKVS
jgi:hypothetical protein